MLEGHVTDREVESREISKLVVAEAITNLFPGMSTDAVIAETLFLENLAPNPLKCERVNLLRVLDFNRAAMVLADAGGIISIVPNLSYREEGDKLIGKAEELKRIDKRSPVVIWIDSKNLEAISQWGGEIVSLLEPNVGVWILENSNPSSEEKQIRLDIMEAWSLVSKKVSQKGRDRFYWYGRTEKGRGNDGVDLTVRPYFPYVLREVKEEFASQGWKSVDLSEAVERCRHSRIPPRDLEDLKLGFRIGLKAPCGCKWHIDQNGGWERLYVCNEECEGVPRKTDGRIEQRVTIKAFLVGLNIPTSETGKKMVCHREGCGTELMFDRVANGQRGDYISVRSDLKCPHCGLISTRVLEAHNIKEYGS